jgi:hypothetical protein
MGIVRRLKNHATVPRTHGIPCLTLKIGIFPTNPAGSKSIATASRREDELV